MNKPKTPFNPFLLLAVSLIVVIFLVGFFFISSNRGMSDVEPLPISSFSERPTNFIGNRYGMRCLVLEQLQREPEVGRLFSVQAEDSEVRIPLLVPASMEINVDIQQRYHVHLIVREGGLLVAEKMVKF